MDDRIYYVYVTTDTMGYYSVHYTMNMQRRIETKICPFQKVPLNEVLAWWPTPNMARCNILKQCLKDNAKDMADITSYVPTGDTEAHISIPRFYADGATRPGTI